MKAASSATTTTEVQGRRHISKQGSPPVTAVYCCCGCSNQPQLPLGFFQLLPTVLRRAATTPATGAQCRAVRRAQCHERTLLSVPDFQDPDGKARVATFGTWKDGRMASPHCTAVLLQSKRVANMSGSATVAPSLSLLHSHCGCGALFKSCCHAPFGIALHCTVPQLSVDKQ